jgi:hypothetical protein
MVAAAAEEGRGEDSRRRYRIPTLRGTLCVIRTCAEIHAGTDAKSAEGRTSLSFSIAAAAYSAMANLRRLNL